MRAAFAAIVVAVLCRVALNTDGTGFALLMGVMAFLAHVGPRLSTTAWSVGADGELRTASRLDALADEGFVVMHDLRIPRSGANIDHLVIGPTGVFVVETKNVKGRVRFDGGTVRVGGRRLAVVEEVEREVAAVWSALGPLLEPQGLTVLAVVCVHRADLPWLRRSAGRVSFVYPRELAGWIKKRPVVLNEVDVAELRARAERLLPPTQR